MYYANNSMNLNKRFVRIENNKHTFKIAKAEKTIK
jgi:hypothetical protein